MRYFYRAHCSPEAVRAHAERFFASRGFVRDATEPDTARYRDRRGVVDLEVEIEGGHYTRVTVATADLGESELDRVAKRFLAELHATEDHGHRVRGAY
jgi:hypothetical protein